MRGDSTNNEVKARAEAAEANAKARADHAHEPFEVDGIDRHSNTVNHPAPFVETEATLAEHPGNTVKQKDAEAPHA